METTYKGFHIAQIFIYNNGTADFEYYKIDNEEISAIAHASTIEKVKQNIDDYEDGN